MIERLRLKGLMLAERRVALVRSRLLAALPEALPRGVSVEADPRGIVLSGKRLRMRFISDPRLRAVAAIAQGLVR